MLKLLYCIS